MPTEPIRLFTNDEHAQWLATIVGNGTAVDYSSGYTFTCSIVNDAGSVLVSKTTGITGGTAGLVTVAFTGAELSAGTVTGTFGNPGSYWAYLTPRRTADTSDGPTVRERMIVEYRP